MLQQTLKREVDLEGIGLHSGRMIRLKVSPAPANSGIVFLRKDVPGAPEVRASYENVTNTLMATTLGSGSASVSTVEHLLAALQGMEVDNARIEVDGPEIPILDGSSLEFYDAFKKVGVQAQKQVRTVLALRRKVELRIGEKWAVAEPSGRLEIHGSVEWDHPAIGYQEFHYQQGKTRFEELAPARTFGFLRDVENLKKAGLARGGSLSNAVVLDDAGVLNPEGLRFADEFVRHKILDALGDFKLADISIQAFFRLHRAGHDLHRSLLVEIFRNPDHFEIISDSGKSGDESEKEEKRMTRFKARLAGQLVASF